MDDPTPPPSEDFLNPPPESGEIPPAERQMAMITHLSAIVAPILGPILVWQINKEKMTSLEKVAKEVINFNIGVIGAIVILSILSMVPFAVCIFGPAMLVVGLAALVLTVMAAMKANDGIFYQYPATIRLIK